MPSVSSLPENFEILSGIPACSGLTLRLLWPVAGRNLKGFQEPVF